MKNTAQYIKDAQRNNILAVISIDEHTQFLYDKADLKETQDIPQWHKDILQQDLQNLEISLAEDTNSDNWSLEEIEREIKEKYGY
ncbi:MAG: endonuclease [Capnocytophaga sp.]|nr:endonuclease [Capnocytophaga sp.]